MAPIPATNPSRNATKSHKPIDKLLSFPRWDDVGGGPCFFDDRFVTRTSISLHGKSPLMYFTIKANRNKFLMVIPPEIITSNKVREVNTRVEQLPLFRQVNKWCALDLQLKQPVHWIMNGESFAQSTGMGVLRTLEETPQLYDLASQTNFTMYLPYKVKEKILGVFSSAPYPQLSSHLIAAPGQSLWGLHAITLSNGGWRFSNIVEPLPSYIPSSQSEATQVSPPKASRKRQRQATDKPNEDSDSEDDRQHLYRAIPSSDTGSTSEIKFTGLGQMEDIITKRVKDQVAQEVERLGYLNKATEQKISQQQTDVQAEVEKLRWMFGHTTDHADRVKEEMESDMYDFRKEIRTMMQGFEEEQRASIDGLETRLEAHQTGKLKEILGRVLQIVLDGDQCSVRLTFPDETSPPRGAAT